MPPQRLNYESAALVIGVGVVLVCAAITARSQPGILGATKTRGADSVDERILDRDHDNTRSPGTRARLGTASVGSGEVGLDVSDIAPFLAGVGVSDAASLDELAVDYGGVRVEGGEELSAADGTLAAAPVVTWNKEEGKTRAVVMFDPDAPSRAGDGSGPGTSGPWWGVTSTRSAQSHQVERARSQPPQANNPTKVLALTQHRRSQDLN